jgi:hypothetical protein
VHDVTPLDRLGQLRPVTERRARPEADVSRRRVLGLQQTDALQDAGGWLVDRVAQPLALQQRAVQPGG